MIGIAGTNDGSYSERVRRKPRPIRRCGPEATVSVDNLSHGIGLEALLTVILAVASNFVNSGAKSYICHREKSQALILKKNGTGMNLPSVKDLGSLRSTMDALVDVSPRLVVLYGWNLAGPTIIDRLSVTNETVLSTVPDIVALAANLLDIEEDALRRLNELREFRNLVAHSPGLSAAENGPSPGGGQGDLSIVGAVKAEA